MYLEDIITAMDRISEYIQGYSFIDFKRDYKTVDAAIRNFQIIGEASKNIPDFLKEKHLYSLGGNVFAQKKNNTRIFWN